MNQHTLDGTYCGTLSGKTYDVRCGTADFRNSCSMTNVDTGETSWVETPVMQEKISSGLLRQQEAGDMVTVPSSESPDGVRYPRSIVDELNAIFREHGRPPIATSR